MYAQFDGSVKSCHNMYTPPTRKIFLTICHIGGIRPLLIFEHKPIRPYMPGKAKTYYNISVHFCQADVLGQPPTNFFSKYSSK